MASIKSRRFHAPKFMPGDGRGMVETDTATISAAPQVNDTVDFHIPAGMEVSIVEIDTTDMDTGGAPALAFSVGYAPMQLETQLTANATYFAAAGQTIARTGGRLSCAFEPIKFEEDAILRLTIGTAAQTFAAGRISAILVGSALGVSGS
jgi:hypothetical protein